MTTTATSNLEEKKAIADLTTQIVDLESFEDFNSRQRRATLYHCRANAHLDCGNIEAALSDLEEVKKNDGFIRTSMYEKLLLVQPTCEFAIKYLLSKEPELVRLQSLLENADSLNSPLDEAWYKLALAYIDENRHADALLALNKAIATAPSTTIYHMEKSLCLHYLNQNDEALQAIDLALCITPSDPRYLLFKGILLFEMKRYAEAVDLFKFIKSLGLETLNEKEPTRYGPSCFLFRFKSSEYHEYFGHSLLCMGRNEDAVTQYDCLNSADDQIFPGYMDFGIELEEYESTIQETEESFRKELTRLTKAAVAVKLSKGNEYAKKFYLNLATAFIKHTYDRIVKFYAERKYDIRPILLSALVEAHYGLYHYEIVDRLVNVDPIHWHIGRRIRGGYFAIGPFEEHYPEVLVTAKAHSRFELAMQHEAIEALRLSGILAMNDALADEEEPHCDFPPDWHPKHIQTEMELCDPLFRQDSLGELTIDAYAYLRNRKLDLSRGKLDQLESKFKKNYFSCYLRGLIALENDHHESAVAHFSESLQLEPTKEAFYWRGVANKKCGSFDDSLADFTTAIEMDCRFHHAYLERAHLLLELSRCSEACMDFDKIKELRPHLLENKFTYLDMARLIEEKERAIAEARVEERNKVIQDMSHSIKNLVASVVEPLNELAGKYTDDRVVIQKALRGAELIRGTVNALNLSFKGCPEDFAADAKGAATSDHAVSMEHLLLLSLESAVNNMFDGKYFADFCHAYFPTREAFFEAKKAFEAAQKSDDLAVFGEYLKKHLLDLQISDEIGLKTLLFDDQRNSPLKITILLQELLLNAVKYACFAPRECRFLRIDAKAESNAIVVSIKNAFVPGKSARTTRVGNEIIKNIAKLMGGSVETSQGSVYATVLYFPDFWDEDAEGRINSERFLRNEQMCV